MQGLGHRLVPVLVAPQFLPVAGGEQQRVVGGGAEHQHGEDEAGLGVDDESGVLRQEIDHRLGRHQGDAGGHQRQQGQYGAAVGEQQDQDHDGRRDRRQSATAAEGLDRVGRVAGRSGDVEPESVRVGLAELGHLVDDLVDPVPAASVLLDLDDRLDGLAVVGPDRSARLPGDLLDALEGFGVGPCLGQVGVGDAAGPVVDDERRDGVGGLEPLGPFHDGGRLRVAGQPGRVVVLLYVAELAGQQE